MRRILYWAVVASLVLTLLFFWLIPYSQRNDLITWIGILFTGFCTIFLSILSYRRLRTWRGLGVLLGLHIATQVWLQLQWNLWDSPIMLIHNLNVIAGLIAWITLVAITVSLLLLLIFQDASVIALAIAWLGWPILLLITMSHYRTMNGLDLASFREQMVLIVPICLLSFLLIAGSVAFWIHFIRLVIKEFAGRETLGGV